MSAAGSIIGPSEEERSYLKRRQPGHDGATFHPRSERAAYPVPLADIPDDEQVLLLTALVDILIDKATSPSITETAVDMRLRCLKGVYKNLKRHTLADAVPLSFKAMLSLLPSMISVVSWAKPNA